MAVDRSAVEAALLKKGFKHRGGDHRFFILEHEGLTRAVFTKVSRGSSYKTIDDSTVGKMARQLKLSKKQFMGLVACPFGQDDLVSHLRSLGVITP